MARAASWLLAVLAALAIAAATVLAYADRAVFDADGFANRADAALQERPVRAAVARHVADAAIRARPDLVSIRALLQSVADGVIRTEAFRALVRAAVRDVHRSVFDRDAVTVTLTVADAGILVDQALRRLAPDAARRLPDDFSARLATFGGGARSTALRAAERAGGVQGLAWIALGAGVLLAAAALALARPLRAGVLRAGAALAAVGALASIAALVGPALAAAGVAAPDRPAARALLGAWLNPLADWLLALTAGGAVVALAAASVVRPIPVVPLLRRAWGAIARTPSHPWARAGRAVAGVAIGVLVVVFPGESLLALARVAGVLLALAAIAEILRLAYVPRPVRAPPRRRLRLAPPGPRARLAAAAVALIAVAAGTAALAAGTPQRTLSIVRCNGFAALCDRPLDDVVFAGTHNSMSADREPGWLFPAQDAGIRAQLEDGVRALLIDTHYGVQTPHGVATDLAAGSKSREKLEEPLGATFVAAAKRLRARIGFRGGGRREVYLCHGYCEVGATPAVDALAGVHDFLVAHPDQVLILSIEDDTSAADTAAVIRRSGLIREVYRGPARPPWPTLREMIARGQRVLVLVENDAGGPPWMHHQEAVAQETPYRFTTARALEAPRSCRPFRGGTAGSLLLVNHWVDTTPTPRPSIARVVNARGFLRGRLDRCARERGMLPNVVAVDFYREGDVFGVVDALNGVAGR